MSSETSILFTGDYHTYGPFDQYVVRHPDHEVFSSEVANVVRACDLSVFNMEDPVCDDKNSLCLRTGLHGVGSKESLFAINRAGFKLATLATNHSFDACDKGVLDTLKYCTMQGIETVGSGLSLEEARKPYYKEIKGHRITILNYSRYEFNTATEDHGGANPLDVISNAEDIRAAKKVSDFVFVVVHEGVDLYELPYPVLRKQMRFYAEMGADAIILHHARLFSGYEVYGGVPIFYGLGNLVHLCKRKTEHTGLMIRFRIADTVLTWDILPIAFDPERVLVTLPPSALNRKILDEVDERSNIIKNDQLLDQQWKDHVNRLRGRYLVLLAGCSLLILRVVRTLRLTAILEKYLIWRHRNFINMNKLFTCQAHNEMVLTILSQLIRRGSK